ncbi:MAG: glycosyltransferase family 39 protein [Candidatus Micrarchaeota archaeon]
MFGREEKLLLFLVLLQTLLHYSVLSNYYFGDEGYYLTWAWLTNRGELIYRDTFHMYSPGPTLLLAFFFKILGESLATARILVTLVEVAITVTIFTLAKKMFGGKEALIASAIFVVCEVQFWGSWMLAEPFMTLFLAVSALFLYAYYFERNDWRTLLLAGVSSGLSIIFKQTGLYVFLAFLFYAWLQNKKNPRNFRRDMALLLLGCATPLLLTASVFFLFGALSEMIYNVFIFNFITHAQALLTPITLLQLPLIALILTPAVYVLLSKNERPAVSFLIIWIFGGLFNIFPSAYWPYHYFPALPPAVILAGLVLKEFSEDAKRAVRLRSGLSFEDFRKALIAELLMLVIICVGAQLLILPHMDKDAHLDSLLKVSSYIKSNTNESDKLIVFPMGPGLYFFSGREPASYYSMFCCGMGNSNSEIVNKIIYDIEKNRPSRIILLDSPQSMPLAKRSQLMYVYLTDAYRDEKIFYLPQFSCTFRIMKRVQ